MSSASERTLKLMAYADGELEGEELAEVEAWLREDAQAVRTVNAFAELGDVVALGHQTTRAAKAVASFDIADDVLSAVAKERDDKKVVPMRRPRRAVAAAAFAALALAAGIALTTMRGQKEEQPMARVAPPAAEVATSGTGVDVDVNETPGHSVSVFYVPSETNPTTSVVVWVDETGEK